MKSLNPIKLIKNEPSAAFLLVSERPDLRFKVFGSSPEDVFRNSLLAMASFQGPEIIEQSTVGKIINTLTHRRKKITVEIMLESMDYNTLLIDFLDRVLAVSDEKNAVFYEIKFKEFSEQKLFARLIGSKVDTFRIQIKEVSYQEIKIEKVLPNKWEALLVFEV